MWDVNLNFQEKFQNPTPNPPPYHQQLTDERISFHYHEQAKAREALMFQAFCFFYNSFTFTPATNHEILLWDRD
jgi:hypothetical protein